MTMSDLPVKKKMGGARPGAGRKPMAIEKNVTDAIKRAMRKDPKQMDRIWQTILEKAEKGSVPHANLLFNYYYGRPVEQVTVTSKQMVLKRIIVDVK